MARFTRLQVYDAMLSTGLVPLFYQDDPEVAQEILKAVSNGGALVLEFTNRGEKALSVFTHLNAFIESSKLPIILGVGSVIDAPTAALYIAHGANFVVGPMFSAEVARLCNRRKIAYLPGCGTVGEISTAEEAGVEIVKVFPGETLGGPAFIKAVLGPMPWSRLMPTGGVEATRESSPKLDQSRCMLCRFGERAGAQRLRRCPQLPGHPGDHCTHPAVGRRSKKLILF